MNQSQIPKIFLFFERAWQFSYYALCPISVAVVPMEKVKMVRALKVFGYDDAPHGHAEVNLDNIELDASCLVLGEGRGFEIAQSRLVSTFPVYPISQTEPNSHYWKYRDLEGFITV